MLHSVGSPLPWQPRDVTQFRLAAALVEKQLPGQTGEGDRKDGGLGDDEGGHLREHQHVRQGRQRGNVRVDQTRHHLMLEIASRKMAEGATAGMAELGRCGH